MRRTQQSFGAALARRAGALALVAWVPLLSAATPADVSSHEAALREAGALPALNAYFRWAREAATHDQGEARAALSARARNPLARAQAAFDLARARAKAGALEEAAELDRQSGQVQRAWLLGPLPKEEALLSPEALPFEQRFESGATTPGVGRAVGYQLISARAWLGGFDLDSYLEPSDEVGAVLVFAVRSERARPAALRLGSTGPVVVRVNGVEVARDLSTRELRPDQTAAPVQLARGLNLVVVRTWSHGDGLELTLRMTTPEGAPLPGVSDIVDERALARASALKERAASGKRETAPSIVDPVAILRARAEAPDPSLSTLRQAASLARGLSFADRRAPVPLEQRWLERAIAKAEDALTNTAADRALAEDHLRLAEIVQRRDPSAARRHIRRALQLGADEARARVQLANVLGDLGLVDAARVEHAAALAAAPDDEEVLRARFAFERVNGHLRTMWARQTFALAERAPSIENLELAAEQSRELGDVARALRYLEKVALREPANAAYVRARVEQLETRLEDSADSRADVEEIVRLLRARLRLRPDAHHTARELALTLLGAARPEEAFALVHHRRREFPARIEPLRLEAELLLLSEERDAARETLAAALALQPQHRQLGELYRALSHDSAGLASRYGVEAQELPRTTPAGAAEVGAHVVAHTVAVRFFDNGLGQVLTDRVIDVHDASKAESLRSMVVPYSAGREVIEVLRAERITRDGRVEPADDIMDHAPEGKQAGAYTDVRYKVVSFRALSPGDRIHLRALKHLVGQQNLFGDFFGHLEAIESTVPVERWRLVVEAPRTRALAVGGRGAPPPQVSEPADRPDVRVYELRESDIPRVVTEPGMPPFFDVARYVSLSTYGSWAALGDWYAALVAEQLVLDDKLKALAHELVRGAKSKEEKVRLIYEHVVTSTRYVGIELGIHGWKPYPVTEVYRRRYGDCKDKASLLVALLQEVGVDARLALVRTADNGVLEDEPASMWAFNHAIAYVPSLDLFLDGTAERSGWRELPDTDQGAMALIVKAPGSDEVSRLVRIPLSDAEENLNTSQYELTLLPDGSLRMQGSERFVGAQNASQRRELFDDATRRGEIERTLSSILPGARVSRVEVTDLSLSQQTLGYDFEATVPNRALPTRNGGFVMPISLYPHGLSKSYAERSRREQPVWISHPWRTRNVMRYRVPAGFTVTDLPETRSVESEHLRFRQTLTRTEDGFIVDEDTAVLSRLIPREDYEAFRAAALAADAMMKRKVRIERSGR